MIYMNRRQFLGYFGLAAAAVALEGCRGRNVNVSQLENQVKIINQRQSRLESDIKELANRPNAERPIYLVMGKGYDDIVKDVKGKTLSKYDDKVPPGDKTKLIAEEHGNAVRLVPDHNGKYNAKIMHDNGDLIAGKGDFVLPDDLGNGKLMDNILLDAKDLPEQVRYWLLHSEELTFINQGKAKQ